MIKFFFLQVASRRAGFHTPQGQFSIFFIMAYLECFILRTFISSKSYTNCDL
jgi:hypothetical protein